jgi:hypothetical protein
VKQRIGPGPVGEVAHGAATAHRLDAVTVQAERFLDGTAVANRNDDAIRGRRY